MAPEEALWRGFHSRRRLHHSVIELPQRYLSSPQASPLIAEMPRGRGCKARFTHEAKQPTSPPITFSCIHLCKSHLFCSTSPNGQCLFWTFRIVIFWCSYSRLISIARSPSILAADLSPIRLPVLPFRDALVKCDLTICAAIVAITDLSRTRACMDPRHM